MTATIEVIENRDITVVDIPNVYIQTRIDDKVVMKLQSKLAEIIVLTAPGIYNKYVVVEKNVPMFYVEVLHVLHKTLKAVLLFYKKLVKHLKSQRFTLNSYDVCVVNKMINKKQTTIT